MTRALPTPAGQWRRAAVLAAALVAPTAGGAAEPADPFRLLGLRMGGMMMGALAWRMEQCGEKALADEALARLVSDPEMPPADLAAVMDGIEKGARSAHDAAQEKGESFDDTSCAAQLRRFGEMGRGDATAPVDGGRAVPQPERRSGADCAALGADAERLACFDAVQAAEALKSPPDFGAWRKSAAKGVLVVRQTSTGDLIATDFTRPVDFLLRCHDGETSAYFSYGDGVGVLSAVSMSVDGEDIGPVPMSVDPDHVQPYRIAGNSTAFWHEWEAPLIPFLKRLAAMEGATLQVRAQVHPEQEGRTPPPASEFAFSLDGFAEAIGALAQECRWR